VLVSLPRVVVWAQVFGLCVLACQGQTTSSSVSQSGLISDEFAASNSSADANRATSESGGASSANAARSEGAPSTEIEGTENTTSESSGSPVQFEPATPTGEEPSQTSSAVASTSGESNPNDTSSPQSPSTAGNSCAGHAYLVCESFEDTEPGDIPAGWERRGDEVYVSDESVHLGSKALKLDRKISWERRIARNASVLGASHWGRIYYRVELPVPDAFVHSTLVSLTGEGPQNGASEYRFVDTVKQAVDTRDVGSRHNWLFNVQPENVGEWARETNYDWQFDGNWHCVEYFVDSINQAFRFFFDGTEELAFSDGAGHYDETDLPEKFDELRVGWTNYQDAPPGFVAYIDDIAFDSERIGCE
jgi:hypothetical protein